MMARIRWVEESDASGDAAAAYARWFRDNPGQTTMPGILKCMSLRPDLLEAMDKVSDAVHFSDGHLARRQKEMIATYVSALNRCPY
jgi:alkylhydroperoxidase family enzyme